MCYRLCGFEVCVSDAVVVATAAATAGYLIRFGSPKQEDVGLRLMDHVVDPSARLLYAN